MKTGFVDSHFWFWSHEQDIYVLIFTVLDEKISQTVKFLIDHGADVNAKTVQGFTALIFASRDGFFKTVKHLITNGAEVDAQTSFGYTALMVSFDLLIPTKIVFRGKEPNIMYIASIHNYFSYLVS